VGVRNCITYNNRIVVLVVRNVRAALGKGFASRDRSCGVCGLLFLQATQLYWVNVIVVSEEGVHRSSVGSGDLCNGCLSTGRVDILWRGRYWFAPDGKFAMYI
jgi:hypothetical protein